MGGLGVDDDTVEVEDDGAGGHGAGSVGAAKTGARPASRSDRTLAVCDRSTCLMMGVGCSPL